MIAGGEQPESRLERRVVVAAVGSELRRDDGAGAAVLAELRARPVGEAVVLGCLGSPFDLIGLWDGAELAVVVDAVRTGGEPGGVHVLELGADAPEAAPAVSSHGPGVAEVLRLAGVLGTAPARVVLVGIEGADFGRGVGLSEPARRGVGPAADAVSGLLGAVPAGPPRSDDWP